MTQPYVGPDTAVALALAVVCVLEWVGLFVLHRAWKAAERFRDDWRAEGHRCGWRKQVYRLSAKCGLMEVDTMDLKHKIRRREADIAVLEDALKSAHRDLERREKRETHMHLSGKTSGAVVSKRKVYTPPSPLGKVYLNKMKDPKKGKVYR